uniref:interferon-induced protein with tetratricopeptide repeats 2 n=1 Tax=Jaculus jaculus TaxID=51337 RepID=UPI001E1B136E|nr:interferon-induced protein with tetratricopeptide repeats 2 [Jaculus jaculus]
MSKATETSLESSLQQLKCHFTWNLIEEEESLDEFEDKVFNVYEFLNSEFTATLCNILAYVKQRQGDNEAALECLGQAADFIQREYADQAEIRSLVTWGNYAWVYYHMGRLTEAQAYVDKVRQVCKKFASPYRIERPELDGEEGWARLKCTKNLNERGKVCFEKALEKSPRNPEFTEGWAIAISRLDYRPASQDPIEPLKQAIALNGDNQYVKVLLALKLQKTYEVDRAERLVEEALEKAPDATDVLRMAAKFYQKKGVLDKAIELLGKVSECLPNNAYVHFHIGCLYRSKVLQRLNIRASEISEEREKSVDLVERAVCHLKKAHELNGSLVHVCSYLAGLYAMADQFEQADYYFQKEFSKPLAPAAKQLLHLRYANFQLYQMKCEDEAIHHFMEGMKIKQESKEKEKMKYKLQKIAHGRLSKNDSDPKALHVLMFLREMSKGGLTETLTGTRL